MKGDFNHEEHEEHEVLLKILTSCSSCSSWLKSPLVNMRIAFVVVYLVFEVVPHLFDLTIDYPKIAVFALQSPEPDPLLQIVLEIFQSATLQFHISEAENYTGKVDRMGSSAAALKAGRAEKGEDKIDQHEIFHLERKDK